MYYEASIQGIVMGGIYGLTSLGVVLVFGIMKIVNWAYGSLLMLSMYITYGAVLLLGLDPYLTLLISAPIMFLFGFLFQHFVMRNFYLRETDSNPYGLLLCTAGFGIVIENVVLMLLGTQQYNIRTPLSGKYVSLGFGSQVSVVQLIGFGFSVVIALLLWLFMSKTFTGQALRATSQDRSAARLMGVNVISMYDFAFSLSCALCAAAGCIFATFYSITPSSGATIGHKAFIIMVLGGLESVPGCLLAGIILGVIEYVGGIFVNSYFGEILCFTAFVLVLIFKPNGLFGKKAH